MKRFRIAYIATIIAICAVLLGANDGIAAKKKPHKRNHAASKAKPVKKAAKRESAPAAQAVDASIYTDRRILAWAAMQLEGKSAALPASIKEDETHPLASHVLYSAILSSGTLTGDAAAEGLPPVMLHYGAGEYGALISSKSGYADAAISSNDPIMLDYIAGAAIKELKDDLAAGLVTKSLSIRQDVFITARFAQELAMRDPAFRSKLLTQTGAGNILFRTPVGRYLASILTPMPVNASDELVAINDYLSKVPGDPGALYYKAAALKTLQRHGDAAQALSSSIDAYPFDLPGIERRWQLLMEELIAAGKSSTLVGVESRMTAALGNMKDASRISQAAYVEANTNAGEFGAALSRLGELGAGKTVHYQYASALLKAGRIKESTLHAQAAISEEASNINRFALSDALAADKRFGEALEALGRIEDYEVTGTYGYYTRAASLLKPLGRNRDLIKLLIEATGAHPGSAQLVKALAAAYSEDGQDKKSAGLLVKTIELGEADAQTAGKLRACLSRMDGRTKANEAMTALLLRYPYIPALWDEQAEQLKNADANETLNLWKEAVRANPLRYWPLKRINALLSAAGQLDEAANLAQNAFLNGQTASDRADAALDLAEIEISRSASDKTKAQTLEGALKLIEVYKRYNGSALYYHSWRRTALLLAGRTSEAAGEAKELALLNPDDKDLVSRLVTDMQEHLGTKPWIILHRYVNRRPDDAARIALAASLHAKQGGSPLVALMLLNDLRVKSPGVASPELTAAALARLGDNRAQYEATYGNALQIPPSLKAAADYYAASNNAQSASIRVEPDYATGIFRIISVDGSYTERKDHPISGKTVFISSGPAYLRAEYDADGDNLKTLEASSGEHFEFDYDDAGRISRIRRVGSPDMRIGYSLPLAAGVSGQRPSSISIDNVGDVILTYKADGTLESAASSKSRDVATGILAAFKSLSELLARFESGSLVLPEAPADKAAAQKLLSAYAKTKKRARRGRPADLIKSAKAGLSYARYTAKNRSTTQTDVQAATEVAAEVITGLMNTNANAKFKAGSTLEAQRIDAIAEAIGLWRKLIVHAGHITENDIAFFYSVLARFDELVSPDHMGQKSVRQLIETLKTVSLTTAGETGEFAKNSPINNQAAWKTWSINELIPSKARPFTYATSIIIRKNGDAVAGLSSGIAVFRQNKWTWYGYDAKKTALSTESVPGAPDRALHVAAIAEAADGTLWIAVKSPEPLILRIGGQYDSKAQVFNLPDAWQISGIEGLCAYATGVIAWNRTDARFFSPGAPEKTFAPQLAAKNILSISTKKLPAGDTALIATDAGLFISTLETLTKIDEGAFASAIFAEERGLIYAVKENRFTALRYNPEANSGARTYSLRYLAGADFQGTVLLFEATIDGRLVPAVLSANGLRIYSIENRFEPIEPTQDSAKSASKPAAAALGGRIFIAREGELLRYDPNLFHIDRSGPVYAIVHHEKTKKTFIARGTRIEAVDDRAFNVTTVLDTATTALEVLSDSMILANDKGNIIMFDPASPLKSELLFSTDSGAINSLIAASDGSVWAAAGESVYRWKDSMLRQWSISKTPETFPANSDVIANIFESIDKKIWAIASSEAQRTLGGEPLSGGMLVWDGRSWARSQPALRDRWFITSYTPIDDKTALAGTSAGFAFIKKGEAKLPESESYSNLEKHAPQLFLGTRGAKLPNNGFIFGSAAGLVSVTNDRKREWSYPERVNKLLPDRHNSKYGSRAIRAVSTDPAGRIFAGTNRGLLIYSPEME